MNDYGLFFKVKERKIYANERTSKYLFSYNYIPQNFEGLLLGPSVSDNLNTKKIKGFKIYNGSINGSNITEQKLIADNVIKRGNLKFLIICLYPYSTQSHGKKSSFMDPHEYWESIGSKATLELYRKKIKIFFNKNYDFYNDYGYYNYNLRKKHQNVKLLIKQRADNIKKQVLKNNLDETAFKELEQFIEFARKKGLKIFAFFYPVPSEIFNAQKEENMIFKNKMLKIFTKYDIIWDFNSDEYKNFTKNYNNYCDQAHLNYQGADFIIKEIEKKLINYFRL